MGFSGSSEPEKMLSYTTPVQGYRTGRDGTERDGTERDGSDGTDEWARLNVTLLALRALLVLTLALTGHNGTNTGPNGP